jgi:predicted acetyltransferase
MAELLSPLPRVHASFLVAMAEFAAEGRGGPYDDTTIGSDLRDKRPGWESPEGFAAFVAGLRAEALEDTPRRDGWVPSTTMWWVDGEEYLGRIAVRHRLTPWLRDVGGHIGYDVRPSARRRGHATAMLRAVRPICRGLGIDPALVTCDVDNEGSRRVIEACGGVLENEHNGKLRWWVPVS